MIPNILSLLNMLFGIFAIIYSFGGMFGYAGGAIMLAMILDLFDGRIARMIKKPSPLGKYLDTFADMITFCAAPGIVFYSLIWGPNGYIFGTNGEYAFLKEFLFFKSEIIGVIVAFIFPFAGSLRLAKFMEEKNISESGQDYFIGMPSTFAGGSIALFMAFNWLGSLMDGFFQKYLPWLINFKIPLLVIAILYFFYAFIMISNFRFFRASVDLLNFRRGISFKKVLSNVFFILAVIFFTKYFLVLGALYYLLRSLQKNIKKFD